MTLGANLDVSQPVRDLCDADDVAEMVRRFYRDVAHDDLLGPIFKDVARVDWSEHLPKLTAFWCRALFGTVGYAGNPFRAHQLIHARRPFTAAHFERWLQLFFETVDLGWFGPNAEKVKSLAGNVARVHSQQLVGKEWVRSAERGPVVSAEPRIDALVASAPSAESSNESCPTRLT